MICYAYEFEIFLTFTFVDRIILCIITTNTLSKYTHLLYFYYDYFYPNILKRIYLFRERGREGDRGRETLMCETNTDQLALTPGMGPDQN